MQRCTDPRIAQLLYPKLASAERIVNIGAGAGSYEGAGPALVAVEPSGEMIAQRPADGPPAVRAIGEALPFADKCFSHALTVLSLHHWKDRVRAYGEISRVTSERFVAITWVPESGPFWLTRDYFPEFYQSDAMIFPSEDEFSEYFADIRVEVLPIPADCQDGFLAAFWKRPGAYLNAGVRRSISSFSKIEDPSPALQQLSEDLETGAWARKNVDLLGLDTLDAGYRLVTARIKP